MLSLVDLTTGITRAGIMELPSGRWAWIALDHDGFAHVSLQMIGRSTERMEGAVRERDFSSAQVERIARDPSIRWWWDTETDVSWELRIILRQLPSVARELTFFHITLGSRSVPVTEDVRLGDLTDPALQRLLERAEAQPSESPLNDKGLSASA